MDPELDQDPDPEPHNLKWDTDKTGARDRVLPKLKYKSYTKYGSRAGVRMTLPHII